MNWIRVRDALPPADGWYLVTWAHESGDSDPFIDYSSYSSGGHFEDRWGSNAMPLAWMAVEAWRP